MQHFSLILQDEANVIYGIFFFLEEKSLKGKKK